MNFCKYIYVCVIGKREFSFQESVDTKNLHIYIQYRKTNSMYTIHKHTKKRSKSIDD